MSIPPRPFRTVSLACALAFTLLAAPCVYAQSGTPARAIAAGGELRSAASRGDLAEVERLLKAGADPRAITIDGKTPHAVAKPEYRDILWKAMMDKPLK